MKRFDLLFFKLFIGVERAHSEMWEEEIIFSCWYFFSGKLQKKKKILVQQQKTPLNKKKRKKKKRKMLYFSKKPTKLSQLLFYFFYLLAKKSHVMCVQVNHCIKAEFSLTGNSSNGQQSCCRSLDNNLLNKKQKPLVQGSIF